MLSLGSLQAKVLATVTPVDKDAPVSKNAMQTSTSPASPASSSIDKVLALAETTDLVSPARPAASR